MVTFLHEDAIRSGHFVKDFGVTDEDNCERGCDVNALNEYGVSDVTLKRVQAHCFTRLKFNGTFFEEERRNRSNEREEPYNSYVHQSSLFFKHDRVLN